jgi:isoleucyl-tRNA synthetase
VDGRHENIIQGIMDRGKRAWILKTFDDPAILLLVWTTTPWILPGNVAEAVHQDAEFDRERVTLGRIMVGSIEKR